MRFFQIYESDFSASYFVLPSSFLFFTSHLSTFVICLGIHAVMCIHEPRLALSSLPADRQLPSPDQLWPFVLWYELPHARSNKHKLTKKYQSRWGFNPSCICYIMCVFFIHSFHSLADQCGICSRSSRASRPFFFGFQ